VKARGPTANLGRPKRVFRRDEAVRMRAERVVAEDRGGVESAVTTVVEDAGSLAGTA
jgi:hypothetical protein